VETKKKNDNLSLRGDSEEFQERLNPVDSQKLQLQVNPVKIMLFFSFLIIFLSCKEEIHSPIPYRQVNITLDLNFVDMDLVPVLATKSITQPRVAADFIGFGGILVINGYTTNGEINLFAYDLACTVEADPDVKVIPDYAGKARCPRCGAVYVTAYGTGNPETVAKYPLRSYSVSPIGGNKYRIVN
jgi:hypothetical protein